MPSEEVRYADPRLSGLVVVANPINQAVPTADNQGARVVRTEPGILVELSLYLDDKKVGTITKEFGDGEEEGSLSQEDVNNAVKAAFDGLDVAAAFAASLDELVAEFPILVDPEEADTAAGPPVYLRVDAWRAILGEGDRSIQAHIGIYPTPECNTEEVLSYEVLWFGDKASVRAFNAVTKSLRERRNAEQTVVDGTNPVLVDKTAEEVAELQERAQVNVDSLNTQIDARLARNVGSMETLLQTADVASAAGALMFGVYTTLVNNDPEWAKVDVATVMQSFQRSMAEYVG